MNLSKLLLRESSTNYWDHIRQRFPTLQKHFTPSAKLKLENAQNTAQYWGEVYFYFTDAIATAIGEFDAYNPDLRFTVPSVQNATDPYMIPGQILAWSHRVQKMNDPQYRKLVAIAKDVFDFLRWIATMVRELDKEEQKKVLRKKYMKGIMSIN